MEDETGLAGSMAGGAPVDPGGMAVPQDDMALLLEEVIKLLRDGVTPEELLEVGVPQEVIDQAIATLQAEMQSGAAMAAPSAPSTDMGLAATMQ